MARRHRSFGLAGDMFRLAVECQMVIGLRGFRLATGTADSAELHRMVWEKIDAWAALPAAVAPALLSGRGDKALKAGLTSYRRVVRRNIARLSK